MKTLLKITCLIIISVSSIFVTWQSSALPYVLGKGFYINSEKSQQLVVKNAQQAARLVKGQYGGKVLKVQRSQFGGRPGYKVKLLKDNGHVVSVKVDAKSGRVSGK